MRQQLSNIWACCALLAVLAIIAVLSCSGCAELFLPGVPIAVKSRDCFGTEMYLDGRYETTIRDERAFIRLKPGWHEIEAKKKGYKPIKVGFWIESDEATEGILIKLYCYPKKRLLKMFMIGQLQRPTNASVE